MEGAGEKKSLLGPSVEESRAKRLEKQKSRFRDRGGYVRSQFISLSTRYKVNQSRVIYSQIIRSLGLESIVECVARTRCKRRVA